MTHMVIKRLRRSQRRKYKLLMEQVEKYISWCQDNVFTRDTDGTLTPVTRDEAVQFILMTLESKQ